MVQRNGPKREEISHQNEGGKRMWISRPPENEKGGKRPSFLRDEKRPVNQQREGV